MIGRPVKVDAIKLEDAIIRILDDMEKVGPGTEEYTALLAQLERLSTLRTQERPPRVSRDTFATVAAHLCGILIIVAYEQKHVMASKGLSFVPKLKI